MGTEPDIPDDFIDPAPQRPAQRPGQRPAQQRPAPQPRHIPNPYYTEPAPYRAPHSVSTQALPWVLLAVMTLVFVIYAGVKEIPWHGPGPGPTPTPVPVPVRPLRVILVTDPAGNMTREQLAVLNSTKVRAWLNEHTAKAGDGRPAWRAWPNDVAPDGESADWQKAWESVKPTLASASLPEVVVFHGDKSRAWPLPATEEEMMALLEQEARK